MTHPEIKETVIEAPVAHEYLGETVEISALTSNGVAVQLADTAIPTISSKWGDTGGGKFPTKLLVITNVQPSHYGKNTRAVTYHAYKDGMLRQPTTVVLAPAFKVKQLTGTQGKKMLAIYEDFKFTNLVNNLSVEMTIGSDPEIFVEDKSGGIIPAFNFLGPKNKPNVGRDATYGHNHVYWDGFQAEFDTHGEGTCLAWQVDSVQAGLWGVLNAARKHNKNAKLSLKTVMEVPFELLQSSAEEHVTFGCMPSLNVYGLQGKKAPARELPFRSAGGHIHFGIGQKKPAVINEIVRALDEILGVACVSLFANFDNPIRREYYGLPGEHRLPAHGLEYRVLSNAWLCHPLIMNLVFDLGRKALVFGSNNYRKYWKSSEEETIDVIRFCDVDRAREIMERNKLIICKLLSSAYGERNINGAFNIFKNGIEFAVKDPLDIAGNWNLDGHWVTHSDGNGKNWTHAYGIIANGEKV